MQLKHFFKCSFDIKACAIIGFTVTVVCFKAVCNSYGHFGVLYKSDDIITKLDVRACVGRLSAAIGLSAIYGDLELYNELLAVVTRRTGMFSVGYKVCAVVKAAYGDCAICNIDSCAVKSSFIAKCLALAVIVCGEDFNVCDICRSLEVRRDIISQDSGAAKINAGLADGFAKLSKHIAERTCIACNFVVAILLYGSVCAGFTHAACIRIVGRDKVHVAIGLSVFIIVRKRRTYICSAENTNGIYRCAVGLTLESLCVLYCSLCYTSIKAVAVIRFTIGKHNDNTITACRHLVSIAKYIDCFFKAVVSRCCALSA